VYSNAIIFNDVALLDIENLIFNLTSVHSLFFIFTGLVPTNLVDYEYKIVEDTWAFSPVDTIPKSSPVIDQKQFDTPFGNTEDLNKMFKKGRGPEFEPNLGKVIDTLNKDYPNLFDSAPNFDIYTPDIEVRDPTGVQFHGKNTYRQLFGLLRFFRSFIMESAEIRHKLVYDWMNQQVKVTWYTRVWIKGQRDPLHVDGISVYSISDEGFVYSHHIEKIVVNGTPAIPPYGMRWLDIQRALRIRSGLEKCPKGIPVPTPFHFSSDEENEEASTGAKNEKKSKMFDWPLPNISPPQGCEDSYDCDYPQTCCDFVAFKVCCNGGLGVGPEYAPELIPIPIPVEDPYRRY